jgi:hypothetical protein
MEDAVGFHITCGDCHVQGEADVPAIGGHAECARCHAAEVGLEGAPAMDDCTGCHDVGARVERHRRRLIVGDLHFDHRNHQVDRRGATIRCQACHADSAGAGGRDDHPAPRVATCVACHDDSARTPDGMRMRACETCHATLSQGIGQLAPRSHLPATERPLDHTLAFRRDHGEDAARDTRRCANCHTQMSGNARAACDECHQNMRPWDHNVMWRESDHGDYCLACHQQKPRSHLFGWRDEHGLRARINPRACFVCHDPDAGDLERTGCKQDGCHL